MWPTWGDSGGWCEVEGVVGQLKLGDKLKQKWPDDRADTIRGWDFVLQRIEYKKTQQLAI